MRARITPNTDTFYVVKLRPLPEVLNISKKQPKKQQTNEKLKQKSKAYSELCHRSKIERFAKIIKG